ncbi:dTDP-4-dehydrorhamnose reductase [Rhizomicrobium palustre]|uniref:dTDP-4-dehydrorhamnose reductase n=1 Tax=Rhizomicrobium palustre TaxID=189966 RepID=A0A846MZB6_9PROT|nr:dTDP-4-dehydrorhamnose reductase [Rhizomicrobium palustre]NIK88352.1 dTDP-4-dehydrorhamnose reductase [Rhizomicrobium palustre]
MSEPVILLLGANGQVGHELRKTLPALGKVVALDFPDVDFTQPTSLRALVRGYAPSIIVNAAAYTAVDKAESEPATAHLINAISPAVLAEEAAALGATLVHYSTDYVFDGSKEGAYRESDEPCPLSIYGWTKYLGEREVARSPKHLIFRTSWVIGAHGANFAKTILRLAASRQRLTVVADQFGAPTSAALLARMTAAALTKIAEEDGAPRWGLYHLVASGGESWNGLARHIVRRAQEAGEALELAAEAIEPITTAEYPTAARRPANSRLDTSKFSTAFGLSLPDWKLGIDEVLDQLVGSQA